MKQNLYLFSDTILRKKNNTLMVEKDFNCDAAHQADIDENCEDSLLVSTEKVEVKGEKKFIPTQNVEAIYCFGNVKFNTSFLSLASYHAIPVHTFNYYGNYIGSFMPRAEINSGNIVLRQAEHFSDQMKRFAICLKLIEGAGANIMSNLNYYKYRGVTLDEEILAIESSLSFLNIYKAEDLFETDDFERIIFSMTSDTILGHEGSVRRVYYSAWKKFLKQETGFVKRNRRPPEDMINCLISFGNTMMYTICLNEIFRTGLLPSIGFLHTPGDNRFPLSFDIAEIFKPVIIDKVIFRVINLDMIKEEDFSYKEGKLLMNDKARRKFVEEIENRLKTVIMHPTLKRGVSYRTLIRLECYNLIKHLKGTEEYKPFISER